MGKYKQLFSNMAIFTFSLVLSKIILSLMLPLYTRSLTQAEYGNAELLINISQLLMPVCTAAIYSAVFRFSMDKNQKPEDVFKTGMPVMLASCLLFILTSFCLRLIPSISKYVWFYFFISFFGAVRSYFSLYVKSCGKNILFSVDVIVYNLLLSVSNVILLSVLKLGLNGYFLSIIIADIGSVILLAIGGKIILSLRLGSFDKVLIWNMLKYSFPIILTDISWGIISTTDKYMITDKLSESANGIYSAAARIPAVFTLVTGTFTEAWTLSAIQNYGKGNDKKFFDTIFFANHTALSGMLIFLLAINNFFIPFFLGAKFSEAACYTPLLLYGAYLSGYSLYYSPLFSAAKKSNYIMISTVIGVVSNVLLNLLLIPLYSVYGACIATIVSSALICICRMIAIRKIMIIDNEIWKWIITVSLLCIVVILTILRFYEVIACALCSLLLIVLYHKRLAALFKEIKSIRGKKIDK